MIAQTDMDFRVCLGRGFAFAPLLRFAPPENAWQAENSADPPFHEFRTRLARANADATSGARDERLRREVGDARRFVGGGVAQGGFDMNSGARYEYRRIRRSAIVYNGCDAPFSRRRRLDD